MAQPVGPATRRSRAANVSAVIKKAGLTPQPSGSSTQAYTGTVVRVGALDWPTVCISDPYDRPSSSESGRREVIDRTGHVVKALTEAGYLVEYTTTDLGGVHGHFGQIRITGRRPKMKKTDAAAAIAKRALEFCREARKDGYTNTISALNLSEAAQVLNLIEADGWTMRYAAKIVLADLADEEEEDLIGGGLRELAARK